MINDKVIDDWIETKNCCKNGSPVCALLQRIFPNDKEKRCDVCKQ